MNRSAVIAVIVTAIAGCSSPDSRITQQIQRLVGQRLKDPDSAKYSNIRWHRSPYWAVSCGTVNAKNSFGAYEGPTDFINYTGLIRFEKPDDPVSLNSCCDVLLAFEPGGGRDVENAPGYAETCGRLDLLSTAR